jgi:hypothetical protein
MRSRASSAPAARARPSCRCAGDRTIHALNSRAQFVCLVSADTADRDVDHALPEAAWAGRVWVGMVTAAAMTQQG